MRPDQSRRDEHRSIARGDSAGRRSTTPTFVLTYSPRIKETHDQPRPFADPKSPRKSSWKLLTPSNLSRMAASISNFCAVSALRCRSRRKPANISTDPHCAVYFAMPDPFELLPCWCNGLAGTLPCEARACSLSLSARVFRSLFRPLSNRSENSRGSIEESKLVSGEGFDHRLQARRIKRKITRRFIISRPSQKPLSAQ